MENISLVSTGEWTMLGTHGLSVVTCTALSSIPTPNVTSYLCFKALFEGPMTFISITWHLAKKQ